MTAQTCGDTRRCTTPQRVILQHERGRQKRQLDDFLTTAAPFNCGGFGQVRASTAPSACSLNAAPLLTGLARCARERAQLQVRQGAFMGLSENLPHICTTCTDMRMHMLMIMI